MFCSELSISHSSCSHCSQLISSSPISLLNHATTMFTYLTDYRNEPDNLEWSNLSTRFSTYLFSLCWQKMESRIMSWLFIGFIYNIWDLGQDHMLQDARDRYDWLKHEPGPGDRSLAMHLALREVGPILDEVVVAGGGSIDKLLTTL